MEKNVDLDRLLARSSRPREDARPEGMCLDAETLAAWADGALTPVERDAAETHAADCERCLTMLAAMATTAPPTVSQRPWWPSVRWLVPVSAAAVAVLLWVNVHEPAPAPEPVTSQASFKAQADAGPPAEPNADAAAEFVQPPQQPAAEPRRVEPQQRRADPSPAATAAPPPRALSRQEGRTEGLQSAAADGAAQAAVIVSPDPDVRWRIAGSAVERSTDGGRTWVIQPTGTSVELLAGASPAPAICWLVGRAGVVLLSVDGTTWRQVTSPIGAIDLVGVAARDGLDATVTAADGRRYRTLDGGRTWTLQENPAAPF